MNRKNTEKNSLIISNGNIVPATKLPVVTIGLGPVGKLAELPGVIRHTPDGIELVTKEAPNGFLYKQDRIAVVRIINGQVLIKGMYDIYCPPLDKVDKLLSSPIMFSKMEEGVSGSDLSALKDILTAASEIKPSLAPAESGRKVVVITDELISKVGADGVDENGEFILCRDEWDDNPDSKLTKLYSGDVFLVSDSLKGTGYRIGGEEFRGTHSID